MTYRKLSRIIVVGILAAALALPGPAWAAAQPRGSFSALDWLTSLLERGISALWTWSEVGQKTGDVDPDGGSSGQSPTTGTPTGTPESGSETEQGNGFDPDG